VATQVDAQAGEQANELAEGEPQPALDTIVDPAAEVRRRLRKISSERLGSSTMRAVLGDIMQEVDVKDFSPADHSQRVAELARQLGRACGLQGAQLLQLEVAALAHDIGKASVPTDILEKRRPSPEEMAVIRKYPEFGADLISIVPQLQPLAPLVGAHQERWNGSGYPDGLQGNDIPVGAQIVALCDVYNVLTTERRYRPAYDEERARQIVRQNIGALWNPEIARIFLRDVIGEEDAESPQTGRPS
jgi:HD-GYP domain-containing protein (c-di-GMP phosphodiesterase class II)